MKKSNVLAVRVQPWQLFKFKKFCEVSRKRPGVVIQEALQCYFSFLPITKTMEDRWLDEYHAAGGGES